MKDGVTVHGNGTQDTVYILDQFLVEGTNHLANRAVKRAGGIYNVSRALRKLGLSEVYDDSVEFENPVTILINKTDGTRTSIVDWRGLQSSLGERLIGRKTKWHHFAYLDALLSMDDVVRYWKKLGHTVSADLAGVGPSNTDLRLLDYVFVSKEDEYDLSGVRAIVHSPTDINCTWLRSGIGFPANPKIKFTLGAGDILAAVAIWLMLTEDELDLVKVQSKTEELLLEEQWLI
jgi:sugar/nucleoside kinase (ribokinase family)